MIIRISLSEYLGKNKQKRKQLQQQQQKTDNYMLTSEIPGTLLDLGCQFQ